VFYEKYNFEGIFEQILQHLFKLFNNHFSRSENFTCPLPFVTCHLIEINPAGQTAALNYE